MFSLCKWVFDNQKNCVCVCSVRSGGLRNKSSVQCPEVKPISGLLCINLYFHNLCYCVAITAAMVLQDV